MVAPVSHRNVNGAVPPVGFAVKVAEPPAQTCAGDTVTLQVGFGSIITVAEASASAVAPKLVLTPCACTVLVVVPAANVTPDNVQLTVAPDATVEVGIVPGGGEAAVMVQAPPEVVSPLT